MVDVQMNHNILWHDILQDKCEIINGKTGELTTVEKNGENVKQFSLKLTGQSTFNQRMENQINNDLFIPQQPKALQMKKKQKYYNPIMEKFNGYTQFPRQLKQDVDRPYSTCAHFSSSIQQYENPQQIDQRIKIIKPDRNVYDKKIKDIKKQEKFINDQKKELYKKLKQNTDSQFFRQAQDFQEKIESQQNRTQYFCLDKKNDVQNLINTINNNKNNQTLTESFVQNFKRKSSFQQEDIPQKQIITNQYLVSQMHKEIKELEGFKVQNVAQKVKISTKNRFNVLIPSNSDHHINFDRRIDKLANPEMYEVKEIKKKKKVQYDPVSGKIKF